MSSRQTARDDVLVTNREIADHFGVSVHAVYSWKDKLPPYIREGSNLRWLSEVEAAVRSWEAYSFGRRFSKKQLDDIRDKYTTKDWSQKRIAEYYGVHHSTISRILSGDRYRSVK